MQRLLAPLAFVAGAGLVLGCGAPDDADASACASDSPPSRTISCILSFEPGLDAGYGAEALPDIVYGPPKGGGAGKGSLDVLALGRGGSIVVGFGGTAIVDEEGADFIVFENAFEKASAEGRIFAEAGEVAVSEDGERWSVFPCDSGSPELTGCAGRRPVHSHPTNGISPFDAERAGGDAFDLAELGLDRARFVRVVDVSQSGFAPSAGFDLDAIAIVNAEP